MSICSLSVAKVAPTDASLRTLRDRSEFTRRSPGVARHSPQASRRGDRRVNLGEGGLHSALSLPRFPPAILAVRGRRTHGAGPMGRAKTRPRTHHRISMRRRQKGGKKAQIRVQFRPKSEKKSKKAINFALPILTFRPPNPLGAGTRPDSASKMGQIGAKSAKFHPKSPANISAMRNVSNQPRAPSHGATTGGTTAEGSVTCSV